MEFASIALITTLLVGGISLPLHVLIQKLSLRNTVTNIRFWASTLLVSALIAFLVTLSD